MPDFKAEIRKRLAELKLSPTREGEIVEELSHHLEDQYEQSLCRGANEAEAYHAAVVELAGSDLLAHELHRLERRAPKPVILGNKTQESVNKITEDNDKGRIEG